MKAVKLIFVLITLMNLVHHYGDAQEHQSNRTANATTEYSGPVLAPKFALPLPRGNYIRMKKGHTYYRRITNDPIVDESEYEMRCDVYGQPKIDWYWVNTSEIGRLLDADNKVLLREWGPTEDLLVNEEIQILDSVYGHNHTIKYVNGTTVYFKEIQFAHRGWYMCKATNGTSQGPTLELYFLVRVKSRYAPVWPLVALVVEVIAVIVVFGLCECHRRVKEAKENVVQPKPQVVKPKPQMVKMKSSRIVVPIATEQSNSGGYGGSAMASISHQEPSSELRQRQVKSSTVPTFHDDLPFLR